MPKVLILFFFGFKSFLELNVPDVLALYHVNSDDSISASNFFVKEYLPLIWKDCKDEV